MDNTIIHRKVCAVEGCENKKHGHIYCGKHYYKYKTYGDPLGGRRGASPGAPLKWIEDHKHYEGDDCIKWPFEVTYHGYGSVRHNGKKRVASRVMCEAAHGLPAHEVLEAAHSCGNGHLACMNPNHLRWATKSENIEDSKTHGTWRQGRFKSAKLTEDQVREIKSLLPLMRNKEIAEMYPVHVTIISRIRTGRRWWWV